jgi:hypothetical protein
MTDPNQRINVRQVKTNTARVKQSLDTMRPQMFENYAAAVTRLYEMEVKARQVLESAGVQTVLYVSYLDFARQLYRLSRDRGISGEAFALAASILLEKWIARGLNPKVLAAIRCEVFNIAEPKK